MDLTDYLLINLIYLIVKIQRDDVHQVNFRYNKMFGFLL
jgi:hypothetical protein